MVSLSETLQFMHHRLVQRQCVDFVISKLQYVEYISICFLGSIDEIDCIQKMITLKIRCEPICLFMGAYGSHPLILILLYFHGIRKHALINCDHDFLASWNILYEFFLYAVTKLLKATVA